MRCPTCGNSLRELKTGEITVDVCHGGCGGIWFDNFELRKVDEPSESVGESLLDVPRDENLFIDHTQKRNCPKCVDQAMQRHFFSIKRSVEVDECPACAGMWLDYGELGKIRTQFESEAERKKAAQDYFSEIFDEKLAAMKAESQQKVKKARTIARLFRFICPSYYIPGDQDGSAF